MFAYARYISDYNTWGWCGNRLRRARRRERVLTAVVLASSAVAYVTWVRDGCNLLRRARQREKILSLGVIGSSVAACIACVVVTATVAPER
jgi:hypothetical protein